jgi:hypothetical protein
MRYNLESALPLGAFKPRGGLFGGGGMTLHGGGGWIEDIGSSITDAVSDVGDFVGDVVQGAGDIGQDVISAVGDAGQSVANFVSDAGVSIDNAVGDYIPGGWGTVAAIAVPYAAPYAMGVGALTAAQAGLVAAGTSAATSAIQGKSLEDTLKGAALAGITSYGLSSLGGAGEGVDEFGNPVNDLGAGSTGYGEANDLPNLAKSTEATLQESIDQVIQPNIIPSQVADEFATADRFIGDLQPADALDFTQPIDASTRMGSAIPDVELSDEVLNMAQMAPDQPLPSYQPTAATVTSDVPTPDLVPTNTQPSRFVSDTYGAGPYTVDQLDEIALSQGVFPEGSMALPNPEEAAFQRMINTPAIDPTSRYDFNAVATIGENAPVITDPSSPSFLDQFKQYGQEAVDWAKENPWTAAAAISAGGVGIAGLMGKGPLGNLLGGLTGNKPSSSSTTSSSSSSSRNVTAKTPTSYNYGSAGRMDPNYLLRNRINASNVYSGATGYKPVTKMAEGGEVKHFFLGGLSDSLTKVFQPVEKAVIRPVGDAVPVLRDIAPYAGLIAAPFAPTPMVAAGIGALTSGFGQPGSGYNMKRALMGGISAYGLSNLGSGLAAAGGAPAEAAIPKSTSLVDAITDRAKYMGEGAGNLLKGGESYDAAAKAFGTRAGMGSAGMALFGGTGIGAVDESIEMQNQADAAAQTSSENATSRQERIDRQRQLAVDAINKYPYQYAVGGSVDDEYGMDEARGLDVGNMQNGMFKGGMPRGYAAGGILEMLAGGGQPRFLSGGGDGMSDSIPATIEGQQEARLADGEFVIPADVVSHIGNGSSKAGAKQLYSMMDRVRKARTGNKKQGKQIKPTKFMPA